jgi:hypothetical protein
MQSEMRVSMPLTDVVVSNQFGTGKNMEHPEDCGECKRWANAYEAATIAFFRLQNQFQIASLCDSNTLCELAAEMDRVWMRRLELKQAAQNHRAFAGCSAPLNCKV